MSTDAPIKAEFERLDAAREAYISRTRKQAELTIPTVLRDQGEDANSDLVQSYNNTASDGVSNIVNKMLALFPANRPFFAYEPTSAARKVAGEDQLEKLEAALASRTADVHAHINFDDLLSKARTAFENFIVAGNLLLKMTADERLKAYHVRQWVQQKDSAGDIYLIITREDVDPENLPQKIRDQAKIDENRQPDEHGDKTNFSLFTKAKRDPEDGSWVIEQELNGNRIGNVSRERISPFIAVGYEDVPGEHYSRSLVEMKMGDLRSLNGLSKAILDAMQAAAKLLVINDPSSGLRDTDLEKTNGAIVSGRVTGGVPDGIAFLKTDKHGDFSVAMTGVQRIEERVGRSMTLESVVQPQGERVTATQINRIAQELQGALGNAYSRIGDFQQQYLARLEYQLQKKTLLRPLPEGLRAAVNTKIVTGVDAFARQAELNDLLVTVDVLSRLPEADPDLNLGYVKAKILELAGQDPKRLRKSDEEKAAEMQAAIQAQLAAQAGEKAVDVIGNVAQQRATKESA